MPNKPTLKPDLSRAVNLNYLAQLHCSKNEFEQAEELYKEALALYAGSTSENDAELIMPLHKLGHLCRIAEKFDDAERYYRQAYLVTMHNYPFDDLRVAQRANFLAGLYNAMCQFNLAEIMLRQSEIIYEKNFGRESQPVEFTLLALALVVRYQGDTVKADQLYHESVQIGAKKTAKTGSEKQTAELASLAQKFYGMEQFAQAEALFKYALIIGEENFWPEHPFVIEAYETIGDWHRGQKSYAEASRFLHQAVTRAEKLYGNGSPLLLSLYDKYTEVLEHLKAPEATEIRMRAIRIRNQPAH